jgi:hypothetical protein
MDMFRSPRSSQFETAVVSSPSNRNADSNRRIQDLEVGVEESNGIQYPFWMMTTGLANGVSIQGRR